MFLKDKKANIFVYVLVLINLTIVLGGVIYNNFIVYNNEVKMGEKYDDIFREIYNKSDIALNSVREYNKNGSGYLDMISCPTNVTMSGSVLSGSLISSTLTINKGNIYCKGTYEGDEFRIFFNNDYSDFEKSYYNKNIVNLDYSSSIYNGMTPFNDSDSTLMSFNIISTLGDDIDDNFDSDNYSITSTGSIYYPDNYQDDDVLPRKIIFGNILPYTDYYNIFWNNYKTDNFIENNSNNNDNLNVNIGDVSDAFLYLDLFSGDISPTNIKIVEFDKNEYENNFTLLPLNSFKGKDISEKSGYLQKDSDTIYLSKNKTGKEYLFDFKNKDYTIFIENTSTSNLIYNIKAETSTGTGIYINPIDDSGTGTIEFLSNYMISGGENNFMGNNFKIVGSK